MHLLGFVDAIEDCLDKKAIRNCMEMQKGGVPATWVNADLLKHLNGYRPQTDFRDGIAQFVKWVPRLLWEVTMEFCWDMRRMKTSQSRGRHTYCNRQNTAFAPATCNFRLEPTRIHSSQSDALSRELPKQLGLVEHILKGFDTCFGR